MPKLRDTNKTQEQLIKEIAQLRQQVAELKRAQSEHKQAEEVLRESAEQLEAIFNEVSDGIVLLDLTGKIIKINKRVAEVTGYKEKYIVGKRFNFFKNFPPQSIAKMISAFTKTVAGQRVPPFEVIGYTKAGEKRIGEIYGSLLQRKGKAVGVLVVMEDITERKRAEEALSKSEEKYRTVVELSPDGIAIASKGRHVFANRSLAKIFGVSSPDELLGKPIMDYIHPDYRNIVKERIEKQTKQGVLVPVIEEKMLRADGTAIHTEVAAAPLQYEGEQAVLAVIRDITERKQAEEALRTSELKYRTILQSMEEGYYEVDLRGNFTFINDALCRFHGRSHEELMGMNNREYMTPENAARIYSIFNKTYRTGIPAKIADNEIIRKDGSVAILEDSISLLCNAAGTPIGFYGFSRDRTEQKKAEMLLRESEQKYRSILETMEEGYYEADLAGNFTFCNEAECRIHGRSRDEMMGLNNREFSSPETAKRVYAIFNQVYRTGIPAKVIDYEVTRKDGSVANLETSASLLRNSAGKPIGFYGVSRDRTEQKRAEIALRESEEKYRTILENIEDGYYEVDLAGNLTFFNDSLCRIYGDTRDNMMGMNNRAYMNPETAKTAFQLFNQVYRTGEPATIFDWEFIKEDGSTITAEMSVSLMRDSAGETVGFRGIVRDITERKRAEEALREREERYRNILELAPDSITITRRTDGRYMQVNKAFCQHTGYSAEEAVGRTTFDLDIFVDPADRQRLLEAVRQHGRADGLEIQFRAKDGTILEDLVSARPIRFQGQDCNLVVATNINTLKQAQQALRESEEKYRTILETIEEGYYESDLHGNITFCNEALCKTRGPSTSRDEMIGLNNREYTTPETAQRIYAIFNQVYKTGIPAKIFDHEVYRRDGSIAILEESASLLRNAAGEPIGFYGIARDRTEQKKAEEALRQSEQKYRAILETMKEGYYESDLAGNFTFCNEAFCGIFKCRHDELVGLHYREYMLPEGAKKMKAVCNEVYRTGVPATIIEYELIRKDGSKAMIETSSSLLRNAAGEPIGFYGVSRDRTAQKKAEEALRQSEEKYRTILETIEDGYYEVDLAGNLRFFNEALRRIHGRSYDEMTGINNRDFSAPETAKKVYKIFNKVYRTGIPAKIVDYEVIRKDGSIAMIEESVSLLRNTAGEPIGFYGVSRDRTEQKKAEEALRQSEEKYRTILETMNEGYYEVDLAGNLTFVNDSLCRIQGYTRDEMIGMNNRAFMDEETAKKVYKFFNDVYRTGKSATIYDWKIIRKDGSKVDFEASVSLVRDVNGKPIGFRGIVRDITERKQAEDALRESEEKYRSLVEFTEDSVYLVNRRKEYLFVNETYLARLGLPRDSVIGRPYGEFHSREDDEKFSGHIEQVLKTGRFVQYEHRSLKDGRYFLRTLSPVKESDEHIEAVTVIAKDITERKRAEAELVYMATHDALTDLPNRMLFNDRLTMALTQARRSQKKLAVMLLDLDYFKDVNDALGHGVGDQLLRAVGKRLRQLLRRGDTVARIGGDEFLLLLPEMLQVEYATTIAQKILQGFQEPFAFDDHKLQISASIGITIYPDDGDDTDALMKNADTAMYRAKDKGRGRFERYTP